MGKAESVSELRRNLEKAESLCDPETDNFVPYFAECITGKRSTLTNIPIMFMTGTLKN